MSPDDVDFLVKSAVLAGDLQMVVKHILNSQLIEKV